MDADYILFMLFTIVIFLFIIFTFVHNYEIYIEEKNSFERCKLAGYDTYEYKKSACSNYTIEEKIAKGLI